MRSRNALYTLFGAAALLVVVVIPLMVHSGGGGAVAGWAGFVRPGPLSSAHKSFEGQCETCHTPHVGVEPNTCIACHAGTSFGDRQSTRFHAAAIQCSACHVEHERNSGISRMNHEALLDPRFWRPAPGGAPSSPSTGALDCASCHSNREPHRGLFGAQCGSCHVLTTWRIEGFRHPSPSSTECAQCHQAPPSHYMEHFEMVSQRVAGQRARVEQCFACHTTDSWNNIRRTGFYDHH